MNTPGTFILYANVKRCNFVFFMHKQESDEQIKIRKIAVSNKKLNNTQKVKPNNLPIAIPYRELLN